MKSFLLLDNERKYVNKQFLTETIAVNFFKNIVYT